jgi:GntR family transcriptional regulator / MocR family aminotransferase
MDPVFPFAIVLPVRGEGALAHELHQQLRAAILDGRLAAGSQLPATRRVAAALRVARNTVVTAYDLLVAEGYAIPRTGAKATVANVAARRPVRQRRVAQRLEDPRLNPTWRTPFMSGSGTSRAARGFQLGEPEHRYFPHDIWRRLSAHALRGWAKGPFTHPESEGIAPLREAIAQHTAFSRAVACTKDDVVVTGGAQQAFDLLARLLITSNRTKVAVEEPGYPPLRAALIAAGGQLVPIPVDDEGLRVEQLPSDVRIVCVTPSHQFPSGAALSLRRRMMLLDFARSRDAVIIEDDYDGEFRYGGRPLDALQTLDRDALVFYVGTFSKSLFPSLRKGFVVVPPWARSALIALKQRADWHCDPITQLTLAAFIRDGHLARYVRRMQSIYAARREALLDGLRIDLGKWLQPIPSLAGLHLAARIVARERAAAVTARVRRHAPGMQPISDYSLAPPERPALVFGYGAIEASDIRATTQRLRRALQSL